MRVRRRKLEHRHVQEEARGDGGEGEGGPGGGGRGGERDEQTGADGEARTEAGGGGDDRAPRGAARGESEHDRGDVLHRAQRDWQRQRSEQDGGVGGAEDRPVDGGVDREGHGAADHRQLVRPRRPRALLVCKRLGATAGDLANELWRSAKGELCGRRLAAQDLRPVRPPSVRVRRSGGVVGVLVVEHDVVDEEGRERPGEKREQDVLVRPSRGGQLVERKRQHHQQPQPGEQPRHKAL
mmetsp:Transcript_12195/g.39227  ORF Transcript_12195/g.39227 Transcript_12195/m.39227 type:complete len:239 (-) Transcript_12195:213-929(-)